MVESLPLWRALGNGTRFSLDVLVELIAEWRMTGGIPPESHDWSGFDDACREHGGPWAQRWLRRAGVCGAILVVDDSYDTREAACELFADAGFEVLVAANGFEAVSVARTQLPDVVLLDLSIPGMGGEDVARALSAHPATRHVCIVGLSAHDDPAARRGAVDAGCAIVVTRPIDLPALHAWIRDALANR